MNATILLVEDNPHIMKVNRQVLTMQGYQVLEAETLHQGRELFLKEKPSLIILDITLPDGDGLQFCEELRDGSNVPILFLSAKKEKKEIVEGLEAGGDDYLPKPYDLDELVARVKTLLRKAKRIPDTISNGTLTLRVSSNQAFVNGVDIGLSENIEFSLLCIFVQNENRYLSAEYLYEKVWGQPMLGNDNALKNAVSKLRKKLEESEFTITTERGSGYCFERN